MQFESLPVDYGMHQDRLYDDDSFRQEVLAHDRFVYRWMQEQRQVFEKSVFCPVSDAPLAQLSHSQPMMGIDILPFVDRRGVHQTDEGDEPPAYSA